MAILVLEILQQYRFFTLASIAAVAGFVLTMNAVNVDSFITVKNIQRLTEEDAVLDTYTLNRLSTDALPALIKLAEDPIIPETEKLEVAAILACREDSLSKLKNGWQGFLLPNFRAEKSLQENVDLWKDIQLTENEYGSVFAEINGEDFYCGYLGWD